MLQYLGFSRNAKASPRGFALVVTLSLMILLTVIAVGLLTLSSISLRSTHQGEALAIARTNARLGLMLAIREIQKELGPDQRITAVSEILNSGGSTGSGLNYYKKTDFLTENPLASLAPAGILRSS